MKRQPRKKVEIYSDGGCAPNPGVGGFGTILKYGEHEKEISQGYQLSTNNRMEMMGVIVGLKALKYPCHVDVYSDSRYLVDSMEKGWVERWRSKEWRVKGRSKAKNIDLWESLLDLTSIHTAKFHWIKGHNGHTENERCDYLASEAMKSCFLIDDMGYIPNQS